MGQVTAKRYHDICAGHRVVGHEGKCRHLHGHNYRFHFTIAADTGLDDVGRVLDFSVIKAKLCEWLEENWDHKFLAWEEDKLMAVMEQSIEAVGEMDSIDHEDFLGSIVWVPFNPTAENLAKYFVEEIAPVQLEGLDCTLIECTIDETRKCSVTYNKD